ncbi:hypothetical protein PHYSODRAFT_319546 [Phytophthora sojae]|uniref:J domain-containing protein n=1 Tax=Phytophthora sojae (strain P6497) TaxID=1094619 RepID=G5ABT9_PHYSP|nr:hypothetical protein PHYSODRAFT_319546 [Phytophthora sojae]EGZ06814.1 hypothetical protein PHYSODRAFT_319546 [Phytophthora sojae]|eukprot:XP_009537578.1 hypothetical protein PHYSODRAFT_319546 [Phytophthora sojae]
MGSGGERFQFDPEPGQFGPESGQLPRAPSNSFAGVILVQYVVPATLFTAYRVMHRRQKLRPHELALHLALLASVDTSGVFDPYETLRVSDATFSRRIKKAFRALYRQLHPDKNLHNLRAAAQFMRVKKAYEALPDTHCTDNYHPDGPYGTGSSTDSVFALLYFGANYAGFACQGRYAKASGGDLAGKMSVCDVVELLLSCDEMVGSAAGILDEIKNEAGLCAKTRDKLVTKMEAAKALPTEVISRIHKHPDPVVRETMLALYQYLRRDKVRGVSAPVLLLELPFLVYIFATMATGQLVKRAYPATPLMLGMPLLSIIAECSFVPDEESRSALNKRIAEVGGQLRKLYLAGTTLAVLNEPTNQPVDWLNLQTTLQREDLEAGRTVPLTATSTTPWIPKSPFRKENVWLLVMEKRKECDLKTIFSLNNCRFVVATVPGLMTQKGGFLGLEAACIYLPKHSYYCVIAVVVVVPADDSP